MLKLVIPKGSLEQQTLRLFEETPKIEDGQLVVPQKPGLGLAFDEDAIKRYQVS